ncbi:MAG: SpoIIE family protein phosphatase [Bacteroidales bacterium]|nr:SpoIIE family protein phosphatase [Bacteroidales bacterium]
MKFNRKDKKLLGMSARAGLMLVIVAAITLEATSIIQYLYSQREIKKEASLRAESELKSAENKIMDVVNQAEAAVRNSLWVAEWCLENPDSLMRIPQRVVAENPVVVGSTMALVPDYNPKYPLYAPYATRDMATGDIRMLSLATEEYDYPSTEWFTKPIELDDGYWSEPYFDENGGDILMTTFSMPVKDKDGKIAAILTADISLDWLTEYISDIKVYPNAFNMVISRSGQIMACPVETLVMQTTVDQFALESEDYEALNQVNRAMLSGQSGEMPVRYLGQTNHVYFAPVERTGWSLSIVLPEKELYSGVRRIGMIVKLLQLLGLAMLVVILRVVAKHRVKYQHINEQKERIENELHIASEIQMAMIPKTFPPFPERKDLDLVAAIIPAKEVGGDLYDFYIRDEKLFFCIGDVSGKGIPASLVMAVTRSLFRAMSAHDDSPAKIVTSMNNSMSETNESSMFVTFFCGVLDLSAGQLRYCNAGHNPPMILTDAIRMLPVEPNLPLGILKGMNYIEQETPFLYDDALFLYTDGLSEAENASQEQFGEARIKAALHGKKRSIDHLENIKQQVSLFVGDAPQSDDLTMLFIHYLPQEDTLQQERHLVLHNDIQQIPQLADFVETIAHEKHLSQSLAMGINLALEEAVSNVILYAYPKETDGLVDVEAILRKESLEFIIVDSGVPFDPTAAPDVDTNLPAEERSIGGLGIHLVRELMDSVSYERKDGKNYLRMIKKLS